MVMNDFDQGQVHVDPFYPVPHERNQDQVEAHHVGNSTSSIGASYAQGQVENNDDTNQGDTEVDQYHCWNSTTTLPVNKNKS